MFAFGNKSKEIDLTNADICRTTMTHESRENEMQVIFDQLQESKKRKLNVMQVISTMQERRTENGANANACRKTMNEKSMWVLRIPVIILPVGKSQTRAK